MHVCMSLLTIESTLRHVDNVDSSFTFQRLALCNFDWCFHLITDDCFFTFQFSLEWKILSALQVTSTITFSTCTLICKNLNQAGNFAILFRRVHCKDTRVLTAPTNLHIANTLAAQWLEQHVQAHIPSCRIVSSTRIFGVFLNTNFACWLRHAMMIGCGSWGHASTHWDPHQSCNIDFLFKRAFHPK